MKKSRYSEEQIVTILRETDKDPVAEVAKRHGVRSQEPAPPPATQLATVLTPVVAAGAPAPAVKYVKVPAPTTAAPVMAAPK